MKQEMLDGQMTVRGRNKSPVVLEDILNSIRLLSKDGNGPTFNSLLAHLAAKGTISNHRSLRGYLDIALKSGLLTVRQEPTEQHNVRSSQIYSVTDDGPYVEAGEKALLFYGLNWTLPSTRSLRIRTDIEGLARARLAQEALYSSLEDAIVQVLAHHNDDQSSRNVVFCAVLLATKKLGRGYLMRRADQSRVRDTINKLQAEVDYLLWTSSPNVDDVKTLVEIRNQLARRRPTSQSNRITKPPPLSFDELVDAIGKQIGAK
jgi:hypothetical protein